MGSDRTVRDVNFLYKKEEKALTIRNNHRRFVGNGLIHNVRRQVVGQQHALAARLVCRKCGVFEQQADIVPRPVSKLLWVHCLHILHDGTSECVAGHVVGVLGGAGWRWV